MSRIGDSSSWMKDGILLHVCQLVQADPTCNTLRKKSNAQMNDFTQHCRRPKSSARNSTEETVALENKRLIRNLSEISHPVSWRPEKGQHRLNVPAGPIQFPALLISRKLPGLKTHISFLKLRGHSENQTQLFKWSLRTVTFPDFWNRNLRKSSDGLGLVTPILWSLGSSPVTSPGPPLQVPSG